MTDDRPGGPLRASSAPPGSPPAAPPAGSPPPAPAPRTDEEYQPDPRRWRALAVVLVAGFMVLLDVSIVNVALPSIARRIHAGDSALQWVVSGYALAFGLVLVAGGRIGDARGRRPTLVLGLAIFTLASAACGAAQNPLMLVVARLVQGFGGGLVTPQNSGLIQGLFRGDERGRAFGVFGAVVGISTAIGPLIGGLLIQLGGAEHGWRWIFLVNVPIGILAIVLAYRTVPHRRRPRASAPTTTRSARCSSAWRPCWCCCRSWRAAPGAAL